MKVNKNFRKNSLFKEDCSVCFSESVKCKKNNIDNEKKLNSINIINDFQDDILLEEKINDLNFDSSEYCDNGDNESIKSILSSENFVYSIDKNDPINKHFNLSYEINRYGKFDFLFEIKGDISKNEFLKKTTKLRKIPRHLKYTLFSEERVKKIRQKDFLEVFYLSGDFKKLANKLMKKKQFREAIKMYTYAYSLLKWIEFKDPKRNLNCQNSNGLEPILDQDIIFGINKTRTFVMEDEQFNYSIVNLLLCLSYSYMELRHYSEALECLNECLEYNSDNPDVYFRRSQTRIYNKFSDDESNLLALVDIQKAISLKHNIESKIYQEQLDYVMKQIEEKKNNEFNKINELIQKAKTSYNTIKDKNLNLEDYLFTGENHQNTQYKILKEMKVKYKIAIKFFTETNNEEQLTIAYNEIESYLQHYYHFKWYYEFTTAKIDLHLQSLLNDDDRRLLNNEDIVKLIESYKYRMSEDIFSNGEYNYELFKYAIERILDSEQKEKDEKDNNSPELKLKKQINEEKKKEKNLEANKGNIVSLLLSFLIMLFSMLLIGCHYFIYSSNPNFFNCNNCNKISPYN